MTETDIQSHLGAPPRRCLCGDAPSVCPFRLSVDSPFVGTHRCFQVQLAVPFGGRNTPFIRLNTLEGTDERKGRGRSDSRQPT